MVAQYEFSFQNTNLCFTQNTNLLIKKQIQIHHEMINFIFLDNIHKKRICELKSKFQFLMENTNLLFQNTNLCFSNLTIFGVYLCFQN